MKFAFQKLFMLIAVFMLGFATTQAQDTGNGFVRFVHVIPSAPSLDVFVNGTLTAVDLSYEEITPYVALPAGTLELTAALTGDTSAVLTQSITVTAGEYQTLIASSAFPLAFDAYEDDVNPLGLGSSRFRLINAIANGDPIDFVAAGQNFASNFAFKASTNTSDIPANAYPMSATVGGTEVWTDTVALAGRTSYSLVLYGTSNAPESLLLATAVPVDGEAGFVRFAHGVADAPEVNILLNGSLAIPAVAYAEYTPHIAIEPGSYDLGVQTTDGTEIATGMLTVENGKAATVVVVGVADAAGVTVVEDAIEGVDADHAVVNVINTTGDTVSLALPDGVTLATDLAAGSASEAVTVEPVFAPLTLTFGDADVESLPEVFYGGVYYTIFVLADGTVTLAPTSLAQTLGSAPGADEPVDVAVVPTTVVETPSAPVEATPTPTAPQQVAPTPVPTTEFPTARVVLDASANQQLREYPSSQARSLGLAPSGSVFIVNGREGAPVDINGVEIPVGTNPDGTPIEFVDPATLLESEDEDLNPADTWLNITYSTPDGGTITAWVNAFTLDVRTPKGEFQRLADLPTVPNNQPGEASNTNIQAPSEREDVLNAIATGLDANVNLNLRRTPETTGEVLANVPTGTSLELIGLGQSGEWAFVRFLPESGGDVTGWVSTTYITYEFNGSPIDLAEMQERNLVQEADEATLRGEVRADVTLITPTRNPFRDVVVGTVGGLNADANLNLRRSPNINAEVIARLPNGTQFIVLSKTKSLDWFEVEFQGETGWVASQYVSLTFNNLLYDVEDLPVNENVTNDSNLNETVTPPAVTPGAATATPTPTPTATTRP